MIGVDVDADDGDHRDDDDGDEGRHDADHADSFSQSVSGASSASASPPSDPMNNGSSMYVTRPPPTCFNAASSAFGRLRIKPPPPYRMMWLRTFSWNSVSTRERRSSIVSIVGPRSVSHAALISFVMSSSVGTPRTGAVTSARCDGSPTKLYFSFHSRTMKIVTFACGKRSSISFRRC